MKPSLAARALVVALSASSPLFFTRPLLADTNLSTDFSAQRVEVNEPFSVQVTLMSTDSGTITSAKLPVPAGLKSQGPSTQTRSQVTIANGQMVRQTGVTLTWTLVAEKPGTYRIGPPSLEFAGQTFKGNARSVEVVPEGAGGGRGRRPDPFDPFGMFQGMPGFPGFPGMGRGFPFPDFDDVGQPQLPPVPPDLQTDRAPDPIAFLTAKTNSKRVVVGQTLSLKLAAYGSRGDYGAVGLTEPSREGFLSFDVDTDPQVAQVPIGGQVFIGKKLRDLVLVPIRTGTLRIGSMKFGFKGKGYPPSPGALGLMRESPPLDIVVVEPPLKGRPPGYRLGDVGQYRLSATVDPKRVKQGEAVSVIATLEGTGNVPAKLNVPQQNGVDWMDPTIIQKLEARDASVHGSRTFTFVVRLDKAGSVDLGELSLPFYDPERGAYDVARALLGTVDVEAQANQAPVVANAVVDRLKDLIQPPTTLGPAPSKRRYLADTPSFFGLLAVGPLAVLALSGATRLGQVLLHRSRVRQATPARRAALELEAARKLALSGDHRGTCAALDRALHLAIEATTGLKSRGVLRSELARELSARKVPAELAKDVVALLETMENARFVAESEHEPTHALIERSERAIRELERSSRG
ncbi:MAG: BatD family protein [Myxococcota bacterium]